MYVRKVFIRPKNVAILVPLRATNPNTKFVGNSNRTLREFPIMSNLNLFPYAAVSLFICNHYFYRFDQTMISLQSCA